MYFYRFNNKLLFSLHTYDNLPTISQEEVIRSEETIYLLKKLNPKESRRSFAVTHPSLVFNEREGLNLLQLDSSELPKLPQWLLDKIEEKKVTAINTAYSNWEDALHYSPPVKWRINVAGLGDVGSTLLIGLRLLGQDCIKEIGIYDRDLSKLKRWEFEINQINGLTPSDLPPVRILQENEVFDCDLFAFCIAARVPAIGEEKVDVRMVQLEENAKIINLYGKMARAANFSGIFAVVSDPVDLLCKAAYLASNQDADGNMDDRGLAPEQIRGYGLGVMNARALYYANQLDETKHYAIEGRAFGPHGEDLVIADSIENYNAALSQSLTEKTRTANLELREIGFKPYIAPALSSGALSIIATIRGEWHYSATFMGGVYMGAKNRLLPSGTELEILSLPKALYQRLEVTYNRLGSLL